MVTQLQQRRGSAAAWTTAATVLAQGEIGMETDTGKFKFGDGSTAWGSLPYAGGGMTNPMTTAGDTIVGGSSGTPTRVAKGADNFLWTMDPATHLPVWAPAPGGLALSSSTPLVESGSGAAGSGTTASKDDHVHPATVGGGGLSHSYLGHNAIGGSNEAVQATQDIWTAKKFTLTAAGFVCELQLYLLPQSTDHVFGFNAMLHADNAGALGAVLTAPIYYTSYDFVPYPATGAAGTNGWYGIPLQGIWLPLGDFWASWTPTAPSLAVNQAYDTSGSDVRYSSGGRWGAAGVYYSTASTTKNYSARIGVLQ